jgi:hypothetical protein
MGDTRITKASQVAAFEVSGRTQPQVVVFSHPLQFAASLETSSSYLHPASLDDEERCAERVRSSKFERHSASRRDAFHMMLD